MGRPVAAITFDYWNTLFSEPPGYLRGLRLDAWERILTEAGNPVERLVLEGALDSSWQAFNAALFAGADHRSLPIGFSSTGRDGSSSRPARLSPWAIGTNR